MKEIFIFLFYLSVFGWFLHASYHGQTLGSAAFAGQQAGRSYYHK